MRGEATPVQTAALLMGLRAKGETADEVAGAARRSGGRWSASHGMDGDGLVDTCGTGGGRVGTLNISTAAAFVVAGAGVRGRQARQPQLHLAVGLGRRARSARRRHHALAGARAEVLEAAGVVFLFAPTYHPAMRHVGPVRKELAVPTIMNLLGPLANPAGVRRQVIGVSDRVAGTARRGRAGAARRAARARAARGRRHGRGEPVRRAPASGR